MDSGPQIGVSPPRKEAWDKVTGSAKYNADTIIPGILHAKLLTSPHAHAIIKHIDSEVASCVAGVKAIVTGDFYPMLSGPLIEDRPPIARDKVRYYGEPVAIVIANSYEVAMAAAKLIKVEYIPLPVVNSIEDAIKPDAHLVHEKLNEYKCVTKDVYPKPYTNINSLEKIRKGDMAKGWAESDVILESTFTLPQADHMAMETRNARAQIMPNGNVEVHTSSQSPYSVKEELGELYHIPEGNVIVHVPLVGGAFGGKAAIQLEFLAYLASRAVDGRLVQLVNTREEDMATSPSKIGIKATLKIGATKDGLIKALECTYHVDCGAYSDTGPRMAKAISADCTGPYNIENVHCDVFSVYTNHCYATSFRGFGHSCLTFCMERMLDKLAAALQIDPLELRLKNTITEGHLSPTRSKITLSNTGSLNSCLSKLKESIAWDAGKKVVTDRGMILAKGVSCFWKTSTSPTDASSSAILTFNSDGSININVGCVEIGPGTKTKIAQILAEKMRMDIARMHVSMDINTQTTPKHWKTVASMNTFMVGKAVLNAADDLIGQLKSLAATALTCQPEELDIENERVFIKSDPAYHVPFKDLVHGYKYPNGSAIFGQIIGHGTYIMKNLTVLEEETGLGKSGVSWTVGAQAVEIEYDPKKFCYRLLKAATAIDVGKVINPLTDRGNIMGGMSMGLGLATREEFLFDECGIPKNTSLRTYKVMHYGEQPEYIVDFIETPQIDAPYGLRGLGEHGILGIPSAVANALSLAAEAEFDKLPISPQSIWEAKTGGNYDTF